MKDQNNPYNIIQDSQGFILATVQGKTRQIEHYNNPPTPENISMLTERINHLLTLGVSVTSGAVIWFWSWFEDITTDNPYLNILRQMPCIYHNPESNQIVLTDRSIKSTLIFFRDGNAVKFLPWNDDLHFWESNGKTLYHFMEDQGFKIPDMDQGNHLGICYAQGQNVINFLINHGINPDIEL